MDDFSDLNVFDTINNYARLRGLYKQYSQKALKWYKNEISKLGDINKLKLLGDNIKYQQSKPQVGSFCLFFYSSKLFHEGRLPYFDAFPLTIMLNAYSRNGNAYVNGLNMHYLPPMERLELLSQIISIQGSSFGESKKLELTYESIKSASELYKPTFKEYLVNHIKSKVVVIPPDSIVPAVFLPVASFKGASQSSVWSDSKKVI